MAMLSVVEYIAWQSAWNCGRDKPEDCDFDFGRECEKLSEAELHEKLRAIKCKPTK